VSIDRESENTVSVSTRDGLTVNISHDSGVGDIGHSYRSLKEQSRKRELVT